MKAVSPPRAVPPLARRRVDLVFEDLETSLDGLAEALLFLADVTLSDQLAAPLELRVLLAHRAHDLERHLVEEGLVDAEPVPVPDRAAHDAAKDVLAPRAIGEDALGDEERRRPRVVGDDAHRDVVVALRAAVALAADLAGLVDERAQQIVS